MSRHRQLVAVLQVVGPHQHDRRAGPSAARGGLGVDDAVVAAEVTRKRSSLGVVARSAAPLGCNDPQRVTGLQRLMARDEHAGDPPAVVRVMREEEYCPL